MQKKFFLNVHFNFENEQLAQNQQDGKSLLYESESKVFQYFSNMRHDFGCFDTFAKIVKVTNHSELRC